MTDYETIIIIKVSIMKSDIIKMFLTEQKLMFILQYNHTVLFYK